MEEAATIDLETAARRIGIGRSLAYQLAQQGKFPGLLSLGHRYLVSRIQLENFIEGKGQPVPAPTAQAKA